MRRIESVRVRVQRPVVAYFHMIHRCYPTRKFYHTSQECDHSSIIQLNWRNRLATILIADDEESVRRVLSRVVKKMGHTPIEAADGKDALMKFNQNSIDLSIVDVKMPKMDGLSFLKKIKEIEPESVVIIMTGYPSAEAIIETIEDDGYTYIVKPIRISQIQDLIERGLKFRQS